ncbi:MAG: DUF3237 family protein [Oscillospiraceae bacterium]|nr:DUF3237 family protein [Oscillospiraceae bacterium]
MDSNGKTPILQLLIQTNVADIVELESAAGKVRMIPFSGMATGTLFQGIIEPCGVDTQITNPANVRHMSARYMLTGVDDSGASCHIFIQNDAWFTNGERPQPWYSVPMFITDSETLAPLLHQHSFIGEGCRDEEGLHISFYQIS